MYVYAADGLFVNLQEVKVIHYDFILEILI